MKTANNDTDQSSQPVDKFVRWALVIILVLTVVGNLFRLAVRPVVEEVRGEISQEMADEINREILRELALTHEQLNRDFTTLDEELALRDQDQDVTVIVIDAGTGEDVEIVIPAEIGREIRQLIEQEIERNQDYGR